MFCSEAKVFRLEKGHIIMLTNIRFTIETGKNRKNTVDDLKKSHQKFSTSKCTFFPKKVIRKFVPRIFSRSPKFGAKSPPMHKSGQIFFENHQKHIKLKMSQSISA